VLSHCVTVGSTQSTDYLRTGPALLANLDSSVNLAQISFSIGPICAALAENQLSGCIAISPEGTAENSQGRQSWVRSFHQTSPEEPALSLSKGTAENDPGCQSWGKLDRSER
jgi:hypothetical protein